MKSLSWIDVVSILVFLVFTVTYALKKSKNKDAAGYFLAGKSQGWFVVGLSLFAASV